MSLSNFFFDSDYHLFVKSISLTITAYVQGYKPQSGHYPPKDSVAQQVSELCVSKIVDLFDLN
jgi:hypothetical protein